MKNTHEEKMHKEQTEINVKFDVEWFKNQKSVRLLSDKIVEKIAPAISHLEEAEALVQFLRILYANIPTKKKIVTDEDGNQQIRNVQAYDFIDGQIKDFKKLFEKYYNQEHFTYRAKQHFAQFDYADEEKFDKLNYYLWNNIFLTADTPAAIREFKHWMINTKKTISLDPNNKTKYETIFGLYEPIGGTGKSFLLEALCKAITVDEKLIIFDSDIFGFNSHYLKDSIGVLYKDEIGSLTKCKDPLKELITAHSVLVNEKQKPSYRIQKTFSLLISGNKNLGPYLFEDEGDGQRRNATIEARGRLVDCKDQDQKHLINYFKLMLKYCPLDEDIRAYVKSTSTTNEHSYYYWQMVKAIQDLKLEHTKNGQSKQYISSRIKTNIAINNYHLPENDTNFSTLLGKILNTPGFFKIYKPKTCNNKQFIPTAKFLKLKLDENDLIQLEDNEYLLKNKNKPEKTYEQMVEEALGNNPSSPDPDKSSSDETSHEITLTVATEPGINSKQLKKANGTVKELANYLKNVATNTKEKTDAYLISNGYCDKEECERAESNFTEINSILLDCDNEQADKDLITKFMHEHIQLEKVVYQTASSTSEKPKFRVIIPLDEPISLTGNIKMRHIKKAVAEIFKKYTDPKASWFFTPTSNKIETIKYYSGQAYKSWNIISLASNYVGDDATNNYYFENKSQYNNGNNSSWRNLPSVKKCLDGLIKGERDNSINAACYAIQNNFTKADIREFLQEIPPVGEDFNGVIAKFKRQYCR